ncbi:MAG: FIST N-terminal domain-containing protein, partial [Campylobacterota bacterium]|nr:FIST N-terminal domain-containing protein [Campylobacterota bacterium]
MKTLSTQFLDANHLSTYIIQNNIGFTSGILVQIFSGVCSHEYLDIIRQTLVKNLTDPIIVGATTDGEIHNGVATTLNTVITFTIFESSSAKSFYLEYADSSLDLGFNLAKRLITPKSKVLITFADGLHVNGEKFLSGISNHNRDVIIAGGLSGDNAEFYKSYVIDNDGVYDNGAVGVSIEGDALHVKSDFSFGWKPIGHTFVVKKSYGNRVYLVDNLTPTELYIKYLGKEIANQLPAIGIEFPFIIHNSDGTVIARAIVESHKDGSLSFAGNVKEGSIISIGFGDLDEIKKESVKSANVLSYENIETLFAYSCMARRRFLDTNINSELELFNNIIEINGFFTYGEFYSNQFLNETLTLLAMSEKPLEEKVEQSNRLNLTTTSTVQALSNLIAQTSKELNDVNVHLQHKIDEKTTELTNINASLQNQLHTNHVTKLPNRVALKKALQNLDFYGLLLIDIRDFQNINDLFGNDIGDITLKSFGEFLYYFAKERGWDVFNLSGDEFVLLSYDVQNEEYCIDLANKLISNIDGLNSDVIKEKIGVDVDININISISCNVDNPIEHAHMAMNYAKTNNQQVIVYRDELKLEKRYEDDIKWSKIVASAIKEDCVVPFYQPIISSDGVVKYEALMRIVQDDKIYSPFFFLDISKKIGKYANLTKIMVKKVFEEFKYRDEKVSINLSYQDIINEEIIGYIIEKLNQ